MGLDRDERRIHSDSDRFWSRWSSTQHGRCPAAWAEALRRDPYLRDARVVVDLSMARGGKRVLLGPAFAFTGAGRSEPARRVFGEMTTEPELSEEIQPGQGGPVQRSVALTVGGRILQPVEQLSMGWPLAGRGEVSLLAQGMDWDQRQVWLRGPISGPVKFGPNHELVQLSVSDPPNRGAEIPPWILDAERWPNIPESSVGARVPIIVGGGTFPCPRVNNSVDSSNDDFLIAYGHGHTIDAKWLNGESTALGSQVETTDALGLPVTLLRFNAGDGANEEFAEVHVRVYESNAVLAEQDLVTAIRKVLFNFGDFSADRLADRLFAEARSRLAQFGPSAGGGLPVRMAINEPAFALDWLGNQILAEHPYLSMAWDGAGIGPIAIDHRAEPVMRLTKGIFPVIGRTPGSSYEQSAAADLRTSFLLRYQYRPVPDVWAKLVMRNRNNSGLCAFAAEVAEQEQPEQELQALSIIDAATANFVADWLVEHRSRPYYTVEIEGYPLLWFALRLGDKVLWTDPDVGFNDERALVVGRSWTRGLVKLRLRIYPDLWRFGGGSAGAYQLG